ncbi:hypothetical protein RWD45_13190 [Virgibacillus soli]|uniref:Alpha-D-phosphohexomutase C-terminal domain-containing protein n=1 Tax=Paracerasibacillus soli TaxID=480284 RepID=A0ABU5CSK2_9BACI|nr:hypothetical protein [Virgibacillus soli]MDY0409348.1 hypothetical protein [Virgibacillus soli]
MNEGRYVVCLRPSGTEPKIKFYFGVKELSMEASKQSLDKLKSDLMSRIEKIV